MAGLCAFVLQKADGFACRGKLLSNSDFQPNFSYKKLSNNSIVLIKNEISIDFSTEA